MKNKFEIRGPVTAVFLHRRDGTILETLVDTDDLPIAQAIPFTWCLDRALPAKTYYVKSRKFGYLHRKILACPSTLDVDHRDHNGLNNRRNNLFACPDLINLLNRTGARPESKSKARCIARIPNGRWRVRVTRNGKRMDIGYFDYKEDAEEVLRNFFLVNHIYSKDHDVLHSAR